MDLGSSFAPKSNQYPEIYKVKMVKSSELEKLYSEVILRNVTASQVEEQMSEYVTRLIEPRDWKAIWRTSSRSLDWSTNIYDFIIEVIDVVQNSLSALITIKELLDPSIEEVDSVEKNRVEELMQEDSILVPIIELFVINEKETEEQFSVTAVVIEHVRYFYKYIWRPWDDIVNSKVFNLPFAESVLHDRLKFQFDMASSMVNESVKKRVNYLLEEGWKLRFRFDKLEGRLNTEQSGDEPNDTYPDETDLYEALSIKMKLAEYEMEMSNLEDPILRPLSIAMKGVKAEEEGRVVHILSERFTSGTLMQIAKFLENHDESQSSLMMHNNLTRALRYSKHGDTIFILPGIYLFNSSQWITSSISIEGASADPCVVILESQDYTGTTFLHTSADVSFINLTIRTIVESQGLLQVHYGKTILKNCHLDGGGCDASLEAELFAYDCTLYHSFTEKSKVLSLSKTVQKRSCVYNKHVCD